MAIFSMMADDHVHNQAIIESFHLESEYDEVLQEAFDKGAIIDSIKKFLHSIKETITKLFKSVHDKILQFFNKNNQKEPAVKIANDGRPTKIKYYGYNYTDENLFFKHHIGLAGGLGGAFEGSFDRAMGGFKKEKPSIGELKDNINKLKSNIIPNLPTPGAGYDDEESEVFFKAMHKSMGRMLDQAIPGAARDYERDYDKYNDQYDEDLRKDIDSNLSTKKIAISLFYTNTMRRENLENYTILDLARYHFTGQTEPKNVEIDIKNIISQARKQELVNYLKKSQNEFNAYMDSVEKSVDELNRMIQELGGLDSLLKSKLAGLEAENDKESKNIVYETKRYFARLKGWVYFYTKATRAYSNAVGQVVGATIRCVEEAFIISQKAIAAYNAGKDSIESSQQESSSLLDIALARVRFV